MVFLCLCALCSFSMSFSRRGAVALALAVAEEKTHRGKHTAPFGCPFFFLLFAFCSWLGSWACACSLGARRGLCKSTLATRSISDVGDHRSPERRLPGHVPDGGADAVQRDVNAILGRRGVKELRANLQSDTHPGWMDGFIDSLIH